MLRNAREEKSLREGPQALQKVMEKPNVSISGRDGVRGALWLQSQDSTEAQGGQMSRKRRRTCKSSAMKSFLLSHQWSGLALDAALNIRDLKHSR